MFKDKKNDVKDKKSVVKDKRLFDKVASMCGELEMPFYQRLLLTNMVYRKIRHPEEKVDKIIELVTEKTVPEQYQKYRKETRMHVSVKREIEALEQYLHECDNIPEELLSGQVISNTVKYYVKKVMELD